MREISKAMCHSFLHACGGVSEYDYVQCYTCGFSPRMWRCFPPHRDTLAHCVVFSTHVEVFPAAISNRDV